MLSNIITVLSGKKTYLIALLIAVLNLATALNWISPDHLVQINWFLSALGISALRAGISKS